MLIRVYIGVSVDGFVATPDGVPAWGEQFDPRAYSYDDFIQQIAAVVMGRTTFDQALAAFVDDWPWKGKEVFVLTSRPLPADPPAGVTAWHDGAAALLAHLRAARLAGDVELLGGRSPDLTGKYKLWRYLSHTSIECHIEHKFSMSKRIKET